MSFPSRHRCRPSPCDRLSRPRSTTAAPPPPGPIGRRWDPTRESALPARHRVKPGSFPCSLLFARRRRSPAVPLRHRHGYPAALHHGLRAGIHKTTQEFHLPAQTLRQAYAPHPAHVRQFWGRQALKGRRSWFLSVLLSITLAGPAPSGSADTSPALSGLLPPVPGTSRDRLPSASPPCCDKVGGRRSLTSYSNYSASRRTCIRA